MSEQNDRRPVDMTEFEPDPALWIPRPDDPDVGPWGPRTWTGRPGTELEGATMTLRLVRE